MDDPSSKPTVRLGKIDADADKPDKTQEREFARGEDDDLDRRPTASYAPVEADLEDDEKTEMMSRDRLMRHVERDRDEQRARKPTIRVEEEDSQTSPERPAHKIGDDESAATHEMDVVEDTTIEVSSTQIEAVQDVRPDTDATSSFSISQFSESNEDGSAQFPVRIEDDLRIPVPAALAAALDLDAGDLVIVSIRKVGD